MYIRDNVKMNTETIIVDKLKILNSVIELSTSASIILSIFYRSHDLSKSVFVLSLKKFLRTKRNAKNHFLIGDFNIDILLKNQNVSNVYNNTYTQEFLNTLLESKFLPYFTGVTRPFSGVDPESGSCIDNFSIKSNNLQLESIKFTVPFTDHYPLFLSINKRIKKKRRSHKH